MDFWKDNVWTGFLTTMVQHQCIHSKFQFNSFLVTKYKLKNGINNIYIWDHFLENLNKHFCRNLKWLKIDLIFISPYELQIYFSFNFFVLKMFDYEMFKKAIIHIDFIKHFSKYYDF